VFVHVPSKLLGAATAGTLCAAAAQLCAEMKRPVKVPNETTRPLFVDFYYFL
jgi:hypothetical protein